MIQELDATQIDEFLAKQPYARLGCHLDGQTYVVPISFAVDGDQLVGQTTNGLKARMMRQNPRVCVELDSVQDLTNWQSVILMGRFKELEGVEAARAMGLLLDKYGPSFEDMDSDSRRGREVVPPRLDGSPEAPIVYAIEISDRSGRAETPQQ